MDENNVVIEKASVDELDNWDNNNPTIMLNDFLQSIRQESKKISSLEDQINIVNQLKNGLINIEKDSEYGGTDFMINKPDELFNIIFRESNLFSPYQMVYTLLGAITSSAHSGIKMDCNSNIVCSLPEKNISIYAQVIK